MVEDNFEEIEEKDLIEDFDYIISKTEDGQSFIILIEGEPKAVLINYNDYMNLLDFAEK